MGQTKAVLFDLFDTLVSEYDIRGLPSSAEIVRVLQLHEPTFLTRYTDTRVERLAGRMSWADVLLECIRCCGSTVSTDVVAELVSRRERAFAQHLNTVPQQLVDLIDRLRASGFVTALVSNTDGTEVRSWQGTVLGRRFDVAMFSHEVGHAKPDSAIYEAACGALDVPPSECTFVADGNSDELDAAAALGMKPICAAWFLTDHVALLGDDIVAARAKTHPIAWTPANLHAYLAAPW